MKRVTVLLAVFFAWTGVAGATTMPQPGSLVRVVRIAYRAHDGVLRAAWVELPAWYGPLHHPALPLVISPHGRGVPARANVKFWGNLPAEGPFIVVNPEGQGRRLALYSWGDRGQIDDLARMPRIVMRALPWVRIDRRRIYAFGGSMGGQETLLLLARHPHLLAGAAAFDAPTRLALRYREFVDLHNGRNLQEIARYEIGGPPALEPRRYASRSPAGFARRIAFSGVPLQLWWSVRDRIVSEGWTQSGALYRAIKRLNPRAPVVEFVGRWRHTADMRAANRLPIALGRFGLLDAREGLRLDFD
jgi:dipeptidyl aminopeptidase/acylaminoacyl peptidase